MTGAAACDRFVVRRAMPCDADALGAIHVRSWQQGYSGVIPADHLAAMSVEQRQQRWQRILDSPAEFSERPDVAPADNLVAETAGVVVGFTTVGASRDDGAGAGTGEVYSIYVDPAVWGAGAGRLLMAAGLQRLRERGCTEATLWVLEGNARARRFYERFGFVADGTAANFSREDWTRREIRCRHALR